MRRRAKRRKRTDLKTKAVSALQRALSTAENDPEAFKEEARRVARRLGVSIEEVYQMVRHDPKRVRNSIGNAIVRYAARTIKKELGL